MNHIMLAGASGRLGQEIFATRAGKPYSITPLTRSDTTELKKRVAELRQSENDQFVLLDVTLPEGTEQIVNSILDSNIQSIFKAVVIGSTGHNPQQLKLIDKLCTQTPVVLSTNFSRGVFLFEELLRAKTTIGSSVADLAKQLGFDVAMWESHHINKKDAPSGTAKTLASAAGVPIERIASSRVGAVVGEHALFLSQESEEIRITHTAHARKLFAEGALDLCERIFKSPLQARLYSQSEAYRALMT